METGKCRVFLDFLALVGLLPAGDMYLFDICNVYYHLSNKHYLNQYDLKEIEESNCVDVLMGYLNSKYLSSSSLLHDNLSR